MTDSALFFPPVQKDKGTESAEKKLLGENNLSGVFFSAGRKESEKHAFAFLRVLPVNILSDARAV